MYGDNTYRYDNYEIGRYTGWKVEDGCLYINHRLYSNQPEKWEVQENEPWTSPWLKAYRIYLEIDFYKEVDEFLTD